MGAGTMTVIRDHRSSPVVRDHRTEGPQVRDHRTQGSAPANRGSYVWNKDGYWQRTSAQASVLPSRPALPAPPVSISQGLPATVGFPALSGNNVNASLQQVAQTMGTSEAAVVANMGPGTRDMYNQLLKDDPKQARSFLIQEMMASLKLLGEMLSNVSKTRSEISMTFARNARG